MSWAKLRTPNQFSFCLCLDLVWRGSPKYWTSTGCPKKRPLWFCLISLVRNILESWSIFHLKSGIHRSIWSTWTFLYNIRELRCKRNNKEYHTSKFLNIEQSSVSKTDSQYFFPHISALPQCAELGLNLKNAYGCYLSNKICSSL